MGGGGTGHMGGYTGGSGYGMHGAGDMSAGMRQATISHLYLDTLHPVATKAKAYSAILDFLSPLGGNLQVSEIWEYETAFLAEISDTTGQRAFDLLVDKFTGAVSPQMGLSMMMNASYGRSLFKIHRAARRLKLSPEEATSIAQAFVDKNALPYSLQAPQLYPGFYKFHTTDPGTPAGLGLDIMVNGYGGGIWMSTLLGNPVAPPSTAPF